MALDVPTLMLVGAFVAILCGALLVFAWQQYREMSPVLWWAASDVLLSFGITLLAFGGVGSNDSLLALGFTCMTAAPALMWTSARLFNGLKPLYIPLLLGPLVVLAINALPSGLPLPAIRGVSATLLGASYFLAAAWTLIMRSREPLVSRWPLAGLIVVHSCVLLTGPIAAARSAGAAMPAVASLFGMIHFEALLFIVGTTIFVVASMRESSELHHKRTASTDSLTGLASRGAFVDRADRLVERCRRDGLPFAVIVLDLDHFKAVNDGYGHATGDRTLQIFAEVAQKALRPNDALGRIGGEEFAVLLSGSGVEAAGAMAERIRKAFATAAAFVDGQAVNATVSAGAAATDRPDMPLATLMQHADAALYRAKFGGRNRVECDMGGEQQTRPRTNLVRVA